MKKTHIIIILILLVIGLIACASIIGQEKTFVVGSTEFIMPPGYNEGDINRFGATTISNGTNTIFLLEQNGTDVNKYIDEYKEFIKGKNESMVIKNYVIDNIKIYKTDNKDNPNTVHYWFVKNNKTYDIYKWDRNENMDSTVISLINSIK